MKKFTKSLLTGIMTLGLLAPVVTSSFNPVKTTVNAKRHRVRHHRHNKHGWHRSVPSAIKGTWINHKAVFYFNNSDFNSKFRSPFASFAGRYQHPEYKYIGHHTYKVRSDYVKHAHPWLPHYKRGTIHVYKHNRAHIYGAGHYKRISKRLIHNSSLGD